jgi:hypothetical protein
MKPSQALSAIEFIALAEQVSYLEGPPGIGKTSFFRQVAERNGWDYAAFPSAATLDPTDVRGAMKVITLADIKEYGLDPALHGHTLSFPPEFLPTKADKITLVVIDDVPTATPAVQAALFQLLLERRIGNYVAPANVRFALTGNRTQDKAGAGRTLTALDSRVVRLKIEVSLEDWINWGIDSGIAPEVLAFHRFHADTRSQANGEAPKNLLWAFDPNKKENPLPRTWEFVSNLYKKSPPKEIELELYSGCVGEAAAAEFVGFLRVFRELPDIHFCLSNPDTAVVPTDLGAKFAVASALARMVERDTIKNFIKYTKRLGDEFQHLAMSDAVKRAPALKESKEYITWFRANEASFKK